MKKPQEAAKIVMEWANLEFSRALGEYNKVLAEEKGRIASYKEWEKLNPNDGVGSFSTNPFSDDTSRRQKAIIKANEKLVQTKNVRDFVVNRICEMVK